MGKVSKRKYNNLRTKDEGIYLYGGKDKKGKLNPKIMIFKFSKKTKKQRFFLYLLKILITLSNGKV